MSLKGKIQNDHMPLNKATLKVPGIATLTAVLISGLEENLQTVDLPDRTAASGGQTEPVDFEISIPMHHESEIAAMEIWFAQGRDPVIPGYKRPCTLQWPSLSNRKRRSYTLVGTLVAGRALPDADMANEGEMAMVRYPMRCDEVLPI